MFQRIWALSHKEFIQIRRDPRTLAMMIVLPLIWLVMFGYAFSFDVKELAVAVIDNSGTPTGGLVAKALQQYEKFTNVDLAAPTEAGVRSAMHRDELQMAVIIPAGYGAGPSTQLHVILDGANIFSAQAGTRLLQKALEPVQNQLRADMQAKVPPNASMAPPTAPQLIPQVEILYNPELKTANVMIPGLLGLVTMFMTTLMTAVGIVREREYGTLEQLIVTPIKPVELMVGKLIPYAIVAAFDFALVFMAGTYLFGLTFAGNLPVFLGLTLLFLVTTLGLGLLLSTVAQNQQQAMQLAMLVILPQVLVSGLIFPTDSMPKAIQYVAQLLPFTHFVPIARGMFVKGQELELLMTPAIVLALYAVVVVTVASLRFRKRLG